MKPSVLRLAALLLGLGATTPSLAASNFWGDGEFRFRRSDESSVTVCVGSECMTGEHARRTIPLQCREDALRRTLYARNDDVGDYHGEPIKDYASLSTYLHSQPNRYVFVSTYECAHNRAVVCVGRYTTSEAHAKGIEWTKPLDLCAVLEIVR